MKKEIWKSVKGYEGRYKISTHGRVKSLPRPWVPKEKILKLVFDSTRYLNINLCKGSKCQLYKIHQLMAIVFLNHIPCGHKIVVDHKDNDCTNNNISNLQLITHRENLSKDRKRLSNHVGAYWVKQHQRWKSSITIDGKFKHLGYFNNELEASEAYQNELRKIIHKESF